MSTGGKHHISIYGRRKRSFRTRATRWGYEYAVPTYDFSGFLHQALPNCRLSLSVRGVCAEPKDRTVYFSLFWFVIPEKLRSALIFGQYVTCLSSRYQNDRTGVPNWVLPLPQSLEEGTQFCEYSCKRFSRALRAPLACEIAAISQCGKGRL